MKKGEEGARADAPAQVPPRAARGAAPAASVVDHTRDPGWQWLVRGVHDAAVSGCSAIPKYTCARSCRFERGRGGFAREPIARKDEAAPLMLAALPWRPDVPSSVIFSLRLPRGGGPRRVRLRCQNQHFSINLALGGPHPNSMRAPDQSPPLHLAPTAEVEINYVRCCGSSVNSRRFSWPGASGNAIKKVGTEGSSRLVRRRAASERPGHNHAR